MPTHRDSVAGGVWWKDPAVWWAERSVREPHGDFEVDWAARKASPYNFTGNSTPRAGKMNSAYAKWLARPQSAPSKDPAGRDSSLWWVQGARFTTPTCWDQRVAQCTSSSSSSSVRPKLPVPRLAMGALSTSSSELPSTERVRRWKLSHDHLLKRERRHKGIGACNPALQDYDATSADPRHVQSARTRCEHEVTVRATSSRTAPPPPPPVHRRGEAKHISEASIPGYTGHIRGAAAGLGSTSVWNEVYVPEPSSVRVAAPPQFLSVQTTFKPPTWYPTSHPNQQARLTPRRQWHKEVHAYEALSRVPSNQQFMALSEPRTGHGLQRQKDQTWAGGLRGFRSGRSRSSGRITAWV